MTRGIQRIGNLWSFVCCAEAASPRITETSICAAQQLFNSSCWAVSFKSIKRIRWVRKNPINPFNPLLKKLVGCVKRTTDLSD